MNNIDLLIINKFWSWFLSIYNDLGENFENERLLHALDKQILSLGDFAWEIGPGINKLNQLVISPGGDLDLLPSTKKIISYAINLPDWEFFYVKPPKQWNLMFEFEDENGILIDIDATEWKYLLLKYDDEMFEIVIQTHDLLKFNEDDQHNASEILLDGILGEEARMMFISNVSVVGEFEERYKTNSSDLIHLYKQLMSLTKGRLK